MNYADLLKTYIKQSRYTLEEISELLLKKGLSASREHLSRLQNGKTPPASEELNRAIAEITGGDPEALIVAAYKEKAPPEVREILEQYGNFAFKSDSEPSHSIEEKSLDELLQEKIDDPDDYFFLDGYLDASEEEKKRIRKYWYEIKKEMRENKVKATKPPSLFELTEDMDKGPNDE